MRNAQSSKMTINKASDRATIVCVVGTLVLVVIAAAMLGDWLKADKTVENNTVTAQRALRDGLLTVFGDPGRLEVRANLSVRAHISETNYVRVPYADREEAIRTVGRAWCQDKEIRSGFLPKVLLYDLETGDRLGSYGCDTGWVSKE